MAKKVSQQAIANQLGISQAIVSGVLNNKKVRTSEETRDKILSTARELGYQRPKTARNAPDLLAFVIHDEHWSNLLPATRGMKKFLEGKNSLIVQHEWQIDQNPGHVFDNVKGCISVSQEMAKDTKALDQIKKQIPVVFIHLSGNDYGCDNVIQDPKVAYKQALKELWELGHRRFGFFGISSMHSVQANRAGSFLAAILDLDYPMPKQDWMYFPHRKKPIDSDTKQRLHNYLDLLTQAEEMPTAIFFEHEGYAERFMEIAPEHGLKVPEDISIIGHSDIQKIPGLATIVVPWEDVGYMATKALEERIANPNQPLVEYRIPEKWITGKTIAPAKQ